MANLKEKQLRLNDIVQHWKYFDPQRLTYEELWRLTKNLEYRKFMANK